MEAAWLLTKQFQTVYPVLSCHGVLSKHGDHRDLQLLCKCVVGEREREKRDFFQLLFRQLEREKLENGCIKVEPVLSCSLCGGWYSR